MPSSERIHGEENQESLDIKKDDKFFTRIMSKETSMANASCRVYYGGASGSIPFTWESRPGTPKHTLFADHTSIPPLTPPPSYYPKSMHKIIIKPNLFSTIFPRLMTKKTSHVSPSSSMSSITTTTTSSSSSSSSWSSFHSSPAVSKSRKHPCFVSSKSPIHYGIDDDDEHGTGLRSTSRLYCGGKSKALNVFGGCHIMENMKNAFLSIVGHASGSGKPNY